MKFLLDKLYKKTRGYYPFFKYCPAIYRNYYLKKRAFDFLGYEYNYEDPKTLNEKYQKLNTENNKNEIQEQIKTLEKQQIDLEKLQSKKNSYLKKLYGEGFMQIPPKEKREPHPYIKFEIRDL